MSQTKALKAKTKIKKSKEDKIFDAIIYTIAVILILLTLYPMYFIVIASISDAGLVSSGQIMFLPKGINFKAYEQLKNYESIWIGYRNSDPVRNRRNDRNIGREHSRHPMRCREENYMEKACLPRFI